MKKQSGVSCWNILWFTCMIILFTSFQPKEGFASEAVVKLLSEYTAPACSGMRLWHFSKYEKQVPELNPSDKRKTYWGCSSRILPRNDLICRTNVYYTFCKSSRSGPAMRSVYIILAESLSFIIFNLVIDTLKIDVLIQSRGTFIRWRLNPI